ncbi:hypothetical protein [Leekyejoonella antrihumi]|uniref:Uncharacterized protein n=1 Tax=Leekyejoonella antrihumi TaxID=1660198 RepID=A0A563E3L8_9MICO|nr:hypothetical protein [Leekyejoonella antrihumi]TWP37120.1 hypothetical protein FGL98_06785 [Leekyejoonella antrihumi]
MERTDHEQIARALREHPARKGLAFNVAVTIFAFAALSAGVAVVGSTDPKVLLYKDCAGTALIGVVFGLSGVLMPRPVVSGIWAVVYLLQPGGTAVIIASTTFSTAYNWDRILPILAFAAAMVWTVLIIRHGRRVGRQAATAGDGRSRPA